ncbi:hypothetical protein [Nonomuraea angiospora]
MALLHSSSGAEELTVTSLISVRLHRGLDGTRVVDYEQWQNSVAGEPGSCSKRSSHAHVLIVQFRVPAHVGFQRAVQVRPQNLAAISAVEPTDTFC